MFDEDGLLANWGLETWMPDQRIARVVQRSSVPDIALVFSACQSEFELQPAGISWPTLVS